MLAALVERLHVISAPAPRPLVAASAGTAALVGWLRRAQCGLHGHEMIRHFEAGRMSLECLACGEQSPGWSVGPQ